MKTIVTPSRPFSCIISDSIRIVQYDKLSLPESSIVATIPTPVVTAVDSVLVGVYDAGIGDGEGPVCEGRLSLIMWKKFPAFLGVKTLGVIEKIWPGSGSGTGHFKPAGQVWGILPHDTFAAIANYVCFPNS